MKRCSQCGTLVSDFAQAGGRCPGCGLTWTAERKESYSFKRSSNSGGCFWPFLILIAILTATFALPQMLKSSRNNRSNRQILERWLYLNNDSLIASTGFLLSIDESKRTEIFDMVCKAYADSVLNAENWRKLKLMNYITTIDSVFADKLKNQIRIAYPNPLFMRLVDLSENPVYSIDLKNKADSILNILRTNN